MKNTLQGINSKVSEAEDQISNLKDKERKKTSNQKNKEKKIEDRLRSLWNNFKSTNIFIWGASEEEREQEMENLLEKIMTENYPNLVKEIDP